MTESLAEAREYLIAAARAVVSTGDPWVPVLLAVLPDDRIAVAVIDNPHDSTLVTRLMGDLGATDGLVVYDESTAGVREIWCALVTAEGLTRERCEA